MEDIIEILEEAVTERLEIAYFKLIKENEEVVYDILKVP